jgi:hypothetical protein
VRELTAAGAGTFAVGVYLSEIGKLDAKPETKKRNMYDLNLKNKDGIDSKWQHAGNKQVDDGSGKETTLRACGKGGVKGANKQVDDGSGKGTTVRMCAKGGGKGANKSRWTMAPAKGPR